jgi:hypothetical protein
MEHQLKKYRADSRQTEAEVGALQLLWDGTIRTFSPNPRQFAGWLRLIGYVETTRNINGVHRQFIRREGMMLPGELIGYMDRLVARTLLSQQTAPTSRSASSAATT